MFNISNNKKIHLFCAYVFILLLISNSVVPFKLFAKSFATIAYQTITSTPFGIPGNNYYADSPTAMPPTDSKQMSTTTSNLNSQSDQLSISTPTVKIKSKSSRIEQPEKSPSSSNSDNNSSSTINHNKKSNPATNPNSNSTSMTTTIKNIKGPVKFAFVNSFWTDNTPPGAVTASTSSARLTASSLDPVPKQEVDPGEGNSILAVTIMNEGFSDITSIKGSFDFPTGFKALVTPDNVDSDTALSSYDGIIKAGNTFTLYFPVSILKNTQVGKEYEGNLKIKYFKLTEQNKKNFRTANIDVPFKISGKVILSSEGKVSSQIAPNAQQYVNDGQSFSNVINVNAGAQSTLQINIKNKGTAPATGVVVRIVNNNQQITTNDATSAIPNSTSSKLTSSNTQLQYLTLGPTTFDIGTISSGNQHQINPIIFPAASSGNVIENLNLQITYNDANGNKKILEQVIGLQIVPSSPQNDFYVSPATEQYIPGPSNLFPISLNSYTNKEFASTGVYYTTFKKGIINVTNSSTISYNHSPIHLNTNSSNLIKSYSQYSSDPKTNPIQIVAGKIQDFNFKINSFDNTGTYPNNAISNIAITLIPQSSSVKILGNSVWNMQNINDKSVILSTRVYASSSLIDTPVFFTVNIQYLKNGQLKNTSFNLGAIVIGNIILDINDFSIRSIGNTPNVVGNILNKGNAPSLFSKISIIPTISNNSALSSSNTTLDSNYNASQYIGTIPVNSPISFNIPLSQSLINAIYDSSNTSLNKNNSSSNPVSLSFLVSYTDDTQNPRSILINKHIELNRQNLISNSNQSIGISNIANNGFIDSFWTSYAPLQSNTGSSNNNSLSQSSIQKEVGPGEGRSILAIDLTNTEFSDISGVTGYLTLPHGFGTFNSNSNNNSYMNKNSAINNIKNNPSTAVASVNNIIKSGQTYTLYFKVNVLDTASVGKYIGKLQLYYFRVPDPQTGIYRTQNINIPFDLPGKVIMDTTSNSTNLIPGEMNHVSISINNKGTAAANGVTVTILGNGQSIIGSIDTGNVINSNANSTITTNSQQTSTSPIIISGSSIYNIGTIRVNDSHKININILPSMLSEQSLQTMNIKITYTDSVGNSKSVDSIIGFNVLPIPPQSGLKVSPSTVAVPPPQSGLKVSVDDNKNPLRPIIKEGVYDQIGNNNSRINLIANTKEMTNYPKISNVNILKKADAVQNLTKITNDNSNINSNKSLMLVAGKIDNMVFNITNSNNLPINNAVITLTSDSSALQIQGNSMWTFDKLDPNTTYQLSTPIFASTSLISSPVSFTVTIQYIFNGQFKTTSFKLGGNVIGDISVEIYGVDIKSIAGIPNIVGNLLNKGNTQALFTTVEVFSDPKQIHSELKKLSDSGQNVTNIKTVTPSSSTPQYLGDLQQDSPLPFSIPLTLDNKSSSGKYLIPLKITYDDSLKNTHVIYSSNIINYKSIHSSSNHDKGFLSILTTYIVNPYIILLIIVIVTISYLIISKIKKKSKLKQLKREDNSIEDEDDLNLFEDIKKEDENKRSSHNNDSK